MRTCGCLCSVLKFTVNILIQSFASLSVGSYRLAALCWGDAEKKTQGQLPPLAERKFGVLQAKAGPRTLPAPFSAPSILGREEGRCSRNLVAEGVECRGFREDGARRVCACVSCTVQPCLAAGWDRGVSAPQVRCGGPGPPIAAVNGTGGRYESWASGTETPTLLQRHSSTMSPGHVLWGMLAHLLGWQVFYSPHTGLLEKTRGEGPRTEGPPHLNNLGVLWPSYPLRSVHMVVSVWGPAGTLVVAGTGKLGSQRCISCAISC